MLNIPLQQGLILTSPSLRRLMSVWAAIVRPLSTFLLLHKEKVCNSNHKGAAAKIPISLWKTKRFFFSFVSLFDKRWSSNMTPLTPVSPVVWKQSVVFTSFLFHLLLIWRRTSAAKTAPAVCTVGECVSRPEFTKTMPLDSNTLVCRHTFRSWLLTLV